MLYIWQQTWWPNFTYDTAKVEEHLFAFAEQTGYVTGLLQTLPQDVQMEAVINTMVAEAIKTSEIEGEYFSRQDVISSIRNHLGLNPTYDKVKNKSAEGAGKLMVDVRNTFAVPLTAEKLFIWHEILLQQNNRIRVGAWRTGKEPMQVISGSIGKENIHFEAPPSDSVPAEMERFIQWFNDTAPGGVKEIKKAPIRSAITHLYFETIHPFEDGNGRIGRAIAEKALSQTIGRPVLLSLSQTIESDKKLYYSALEQAQKTGDVSNWIHYFVDVVVQAQVKAKEVVQFILHKSAFFDRHKAQLNNRQLKVMKKMLDSGTEGFKGGMSAKKYSSITGASKATATRDLQELLKLGAFKSFGGGRSTGYELNL